MRERSDQHIYIHAHWYRSDVDLTMVCNFFFRLCLMVHYALYRMYVRICI